MSRLPRRCSRILRASLVAFLALGLPACATGVFGKGQFRTYAGPPKAVAEVAILSSSGQTPLILHNIDGTPGPNKSLGKGEPMFSSSWDWGFTIELVPGEHTLVFDYVNHTGNMVFMATEHDEVTFVAEAGHLYRAIGANIGTKWGATVVDAGPIPAGFVRPTRTHVAAPPADAASLTPATAPEYLHPSFSRDPAIRSFAVVPPRIEASGKDATDASRIATLTGQLQELVAAALRKSGWEVTEGAFGEKTMDEPGKAALVAAQSAYDALAPGLQSRPKDVAKGAFSLGDDGRRVGSTTAVDALVFVRGTAALESDVKAYSEPGKLGFTITPRNEVRAQFSIVDAGTGDVLFVFSAAGRGDNATTRTRLERGISSAIASLPH